MQSSLASQSREMRPVIEAELKRQVRRLARQPTRKFYDLLAYHMGWGDAVRRGRGGKRIRPLLSLLVCAAVGGRWRQAAPGAAALELLHNFSLVHDDIQDNSPTRRGRPTLWMKAGMPIAINAGDALFTIANQAALDLSRAFGPVEVFAVSAILQEACLDLTKGQYLDLSHQKARALPLKAYWQMIEGKTAALIGACTHVGAVLGGADESRCDGYRKFGRLLGLAFQVQDDLLGIWGEESTTGKSAATDLVEGKLSLPVVYGLAHSSKFASLWRRSHRRASSSAKLRTLLEQAGARDYATQQAERLTRRAMALLRRLGPHGEPGAALYELGMQLLSRRG